MSESRNVTGFIKGLVGQRDELNQEIQAKIVQRQGLILKDTFEVVSFVPQTDCVNTIPPIQQNPTETAT